MAEIVTHPAPPVESASAPSVTHVDALPPGTRLAEFEIQGLLGVGGFGLVYRAYDTSLQRTVAIKEYMPAALAARLDGTTVSVRSSADQGTYQSGLQSFIAEARLLAQFDHPSLVKVYRFFEANNTAYMVMPLYSGMTLKQARTLMAAPPPEEWLRTVLWSVLQGLHVLHRSEALHRDVSPDNIFLQDIGPPVLLDLGAARRAITDKSHKLTAILKVNYAPIEQFAEADDLKQGPWTDLYSLAAVVYSCLRNDPPLPATTRVVRDSQPSVRSVAATVKQHFGLAYSDEFVRTIQHALSVQPADRPQSLAAFVTAMKLKAPPRLSKFDWRTELGSSLRKDEEDYNSRQFWHTQPQDAVEAVQASARSGPRRHGRKLAWVAGLVLVLGAAALVLDRVLPKASLVASPEPASVPAVVAPVPVPAPVPESSVAADSAPLPVAAEPVPRRPAAEPRPPVARPAPAAVAEEERKPVARPSPRPAPPPAAEPVAVPAPAPVARELCAEAGFLSRPMCLHQECQKAENRQLPVCVEARKRAAETPPVGSP
ncbi:MAG: serine/threonine-protein kinase [Hylemonella sp.]|uniref:serine/threonine protein kinase n=1 Tax=Hylemonella sp. TaxID=2066020 RepID=UPI0022BC1AAA|nr:serine/threonine-protein kinase [Hylemonella sp.]MCZ8252606.1 serine/threonine-protein kinase [Hylemonella sp.]